MGYINRTEQDCIQVRTEIGDLAEDFMSMLEGFLPRYTKTIGRDGGHVCMSCGHKYLKGDACPKCGNTPGVVIEPGERYSGSRVCAFEIWEEAYSERTSRTYYLQRTVVAEYETFMRGGGIHSKQPAKAESFLRMDEMFVHFHSPVTGTRVATVSRHLLGGVNRPHIPFDRDSGWTAYKPEHHQYCWHWNTRLVIDPRGLRKRLKEINDAKAIT